MFFKRNRDILNAKHFQNSIVYYLFFDLLVCLTFFFLFQLSIFVVLYYIWEFSRIHW